MRHLPSTDLQTTQPLRQLYYELGRTLLASERVQEAIGFLQRALEAEGDSPEAWEIRYLLGKAYQAEKELTEAFRAYIESIVQTPDAADLVLPLVHKLLTPAMASAHDEWLRACLEPLTADERVDLADRLEIVIFLGRAQLLLTNYAASLAYFEQGSQLKENETRVLEGLGEALWRNGQPEPALQALHRANLLASQGQSAERGPIINVRLVRLLISLGQYQAALERIEAIGITAERYRFELLVSRGICQLGLGNPDEALQIANTALQEDPTSMQAQLLRVQAQIALHRYSEALSAVESLLTQDPTNIDVALVKVQASIEGQQNMEAALQLLDRQLKRKKFSLDLLEDYLKSPLLRARATDGNTQYFLAKVHYHLYTGYPNRTLDQALEEIERALSLGLKGEPGQRDPEIEAYLLKANIHQANQQPAAAASAYYEAARRYYWLNDHQTALQYLEKSVELNPENAMAWWYLADSSRILSYRTEPPYIDRQKTLDSLGHWEQGSKRSVPGRDESWVFLVRAYISEQLAQLPERDKWLEYWCALLSMEKACLQLPSGQRWALLARYCRFSVLNLNALVATEQALVDSPDDLTVLQERAAILIDLGQYEPAEALVDRLIDHYEQQNDELSENYFKSFRAVIYYYTARYEQALATINESMQTAPDDPWNRNARASMYTQLRDLERANQDYAFVLEQQHNPDLRGDPLLFAWASFSLGQFEESIKFSEQALREPGSAYEGYMNLCRIYLVRGDFEKAREYFDQALPLAKDRRVLTNARYNFETIMWRAELEGWANGEAIRRAISEPGGFLDRVQQREEQIHLSLMPPALLEEAILELQNVQPPETSRPVADVAARAGLARLYVQNKDWDQSEAAYRWLADPSRDFAEAYIGLENLATAMIVAANDFFSAGQKEPGESLLLRSEGLLLEALQAYPQRDAGIHVLADDYYRAYGRPEKAIQLFTRIRQIKGEENEASYQNRLGNVHYHQREYADAEARYRKAIETDPSQAVYYSNLAKALRGRKLWQESKQLLEKAYALNGREADYKREMALTYNDQGVDLFEKQSYQEAAQAYLTSIEWDNSDPVIYSNLAVTYARLEDWSTAISYSQKALELGGDDPQYRRRLAFAYNDLGNHFSSQGDHKSAVEQYEKAIELYQQDPVIYSNLALSSSQLGNWSAAISYSQKALELGGDDPQYRRRLAFAYNDLGNHFSSQGDHKSAVEQYEKAIELYQQDPVIYSNLALSSSQLGNWSAAISYSQKALELGGDDPQYRRRLALAHNDFGIHFSNQGDHKSAVEQYEKAVQLYQEDPVIYSNLALSSSRLEDWSAAISYSQKALELSGDDPQFRRRLALAYNDFGNYFANQGDHKSAVEQYEKAIELYQEDPVIYSNLALSSSQLGDWPTAISYYQKALELSGDDPQFRRRLALAYNDFGIHFSNQEDHKNAVQQYEKAVQIHQEDPVIYSNLAMSHARLENWPTAISFYQKACDLGGDDPQYRRRLALAYNDFGNSFAGQEDHRSAVEQYEKAVQLYQEDPVMYVNLGFSSGRLEQWEKALDCFSQAVQLDPENEEYRKFLQIAQDRIASL